MRSPSIFDKIGGGQTGEQLQGPSDNNLKFLKRNILGKRREKGGSRNFHFRSRGAPTPLQMYPIFCRNG